MGVQPCLATSSSPFRRFAVISFAVVLGVVYALRQTN
jgi:hypothetical protein